MKSTLRNTSPVAITALLLSFFLLPLGSAVMAQRPAGGPGFHGQQGESGAHGKHGKRDQTRLFEYLGMSEEQQKSWTAVQEDARSVGKEFFERMRDNREALQAAIEEGTDEARIGRLTLDGRAIREEMKAHRESVEAKLVALLDDEQQQKYEAFQAARAERSPRGRRGEGPRGKRGQRGANPGQ
jgi:hypothetical protein